MNKDFLKDMVRDFEHVDPPLFYMIIGFILLVAATFFLGIPVILFFVARLLWSYHYLFVAVPIGIMTLITFIGYYVTKFVNGQHSNSEQIEVNESL